MVRSLGTPLVAEPKAQARTRLLLVADFSADANGPGHEAQALATRLLEAGEVVITTSYQSLPTLRVADMLITSLLVTNRVDVAVVEVRAGAALRWATWVTSVLQRTGVPIVHVLRGARLTDFAKANGERFSRLLEMSSAVVAVSGYQYDELSGFAEIAEVIPQPVDVRAYPYKARTTVGPKLAWSGSLRAECETPLAVSVLAQLTARAAERANGALTEPLRPQLTLIDQNAGADSRSKTIAAAARLGVSGQLAVTDRSARAELPALLARADIYLNTLESDVPPHGLVAALACGLCVVSTDGRSSPYLLRDGIDALLVPTGDPEAMAAAVERITEDAELAGSLSRNARAKAEAHDWSRLLPKWRSVLHKVASRPRGVA